MTEQSTVVDSVVAQEAFASEVSAPTSSQTVAPVSNEKVEETSYTKEDLKRVREQEKSKLYPQIDSLKEELNVLKKEREERLAEAAAKQQAAEEEARKKAESEMDTRELLAVKEKEWQSQLEEERLERQRAFSLLEREREYASLTEYRTRRISEEQDNIMPELLDLITGNSPEEIEQSITSLRERSSRILDSAQSAMQSARREMTGSRVTMPPSGPMDTNSDQQQFTPEQISAMSVSEYAKYRDRLLGKASNSRNKGIFG